MFMTGEKEYLDLLEKMKQHGITIIGTSRYLGTKKRH
jgi:hypothetical protein